MRDAPVEESDVWSPDSKFHAPRICGAWLIADHPQIPSDNGPGILSAIGL
jgi:hypothetical protein